MRLKITFRLSGYPQLLPFNYQYPISSWIKKILQSAEFDFQQTYYNSSYGKSNWSCFDLFTFSHLSFPPKTCRIADIKMVNEMRRRHYLCLICKSDRLEVWSKMAHLTISFNLPLSLEPMLIELFKGKKAYIGDLVSGLEMEVDNVECLSSTVKCIASQVFRTLTPIVVGVNTIEDRYEQYKPPIHPMYKQVFLSNVLGKYQASGGKTYTLNDLDFELLQLYPKTSLQIIKAFTREEIQIRGYYFKFKLTAPQRVMEASLNSGFGSMNSLGFGFCETVEKEVAVNK